MKTNIEKRAFNKGLHEVDTMPGKLGKRLRAELMTGLRLRSRAALSARACGLVDHTPIEIDGIERIFREYGCNTPWGE